MMTCSYYNCLDHGKWIICLPSDSVPFYFCEIHWKKIRYLYINIEVCENWSFLLDSYNSTNDFHKLDYVKYIDLLLDSKICSNDSPRFYTHLATAIDLAQNSLQSRNRFLKLIFKRKDSMVFTKKLTACVLHAKARLNEAPKQREKTKIDYNARFFSKCDYRKCTSYEGRFCVTISQAEKAYFCVNHIEEMSNFFERWKRFANYLLGYYHQDFFTLQPAQTLLLSANEKSPSNNAIAFSQEALCQMFTFRSHLRSDLSFPELNLEYGDILTALQSWKICLPSKFLSGFQCAYLDCLELDTCRLSTFLKIEVKTRDQPIYFCAKHMWGMSCIYLVYKELENSCFVEESSLCELPFLNLFKFQTHCKDKSKSQVYFKQATFIVGFSWRLRTIFQHLMKSETTKGPSGHSYWRKTLQNWFFKETI